MRLTTKRNGKNVIPLLNAVCGIDMPHWMIEGNSVQQFLSGDAADRLAAYEESGLEPNEVELGPVCAGCDGKTADGKRTSRCPYPNVIEKCFEREKHIISLLKAEADGRVIVLPCKVGDTVYAPTRNIISEFRVEVFEYGGYNERFLRIGWHLTKGITGNFRLDGIRASEIGKTVFLSREEAEAALKGEKA